MEVRELQHTPEMVQFDHQKLEVTDFVRHRNTPGTARFSNHFRIDPGREDELLVPTLQQVRDRRNFVPRRDYRVSIPGHRT